MLPVMGLRRRAWPGLPSGPASEVTEPCTQTCLRKTRAEMIGKQAICILHKLSSMEISSVGSPKARRGDGRSRGHAARLQKDIARRIQPQRGGETAREQRRDGYA